MDKKLALAAVAIVGLAGLATWSAAQTPAARTPAASPKSRLTSTGDSPGLDASRAALRGSPLDAEPSPGSSRPAGSLIRIDHALVISLDPIKLPAREAAAIKEISVRKGQEVKVDEILGQLDDRDSLTKKKIAELERDAAKVQAESDAQIEAAKKGEEVTRENYKANEDLERKSPGALSQFDKRRSVFEWERSKAQIKVAEVEKAVAYATQLAKEGQIEGAMNEIERRKIVAPIDGIVTEIYKHKGEWCQPGDPVMEIVRMDRLEIEGFVYSADASPQKVLGKPVEVVVQLAGGETYKASGVITFASPVLEGSGRIRQFRVSTEIDNKKEGIHWIIQPGTDAEMTINMSPPAPRPIAAPKPGLPAGAKPAVPGTKVESYKPALPETGTKSDSKADSKSDSKSKPAEPKSDATKPASGAKTDSGKPEPAKSDASKTAAEKPAPSAATSDSKSAAKSDKESKPSGEADATSKSKEPAVGEKSEKPAEKSGKEPVKSSSKKV